MTDGCLCPVHLLHPSILLAMKNAVSVLIAFVFALSSYSQEKTTVSNEEPIHVKESNAIWYAAVTDTLAGAIESTGQDSLAACFARVPRGRGVAKPAWVHALLASLRCSARAGLVRLWRPVRGGWVRKLRGGVFVRAGHDSGLRPVKPMLFRASPSKTDAFSGFAHFTGRSPKSRRF